MRLRRRIEQCPAWIRLADREPHDDRHGTVDVADVVRNVTSFIAAQGDEAYADPMASLILRLMALLALMLMPVGMGAAPAAAVAPQAMSSEHCSGHEEDRSHHVDRDMHCAACAALPAIAVR